MEVEHRLFAEENGHPRGHPIHFHSMIIPSVPPSFQQSEGPSVVLFRLPSIGREAVNVARELLLFFIRCLNGYLQLKLPSAGPVAHPKSIRTSGIRNPGQ